MTTPVNSKTQTTPINGTPAEIDMTKVSLAQGQQTVAAEIIIPSTDEAYARGTYYATIKN